MMRRSLLAAVFAMILSACGAGSALFGPSTGAVSGHVEVRACGGAARPEQTGCPSRPFAGVTLTFQPASGTAAQGSAKTVRTDPKGAYRIDLAAGTYSVTSSASSSAGPLPESFSGGKSAVGGFGGPRQVIVTAGKTVTVDFVYVIEML